MSGNGSIAQDLGIVGAEHPGHRDPVITIGARQLPLLSGRKMPIAQAGVLAQVRRKGGLAVPLQIRWRRAKDSGCWNDLAEGQARRWQLGDPQRDIESAP